MIKYSLIALAVIVFAVLWSLTKKCPKLFAKYVGWSKSAYGADFNAFDADFNKHPVFSAETADGKEAEYINEKLHQERNIVRFLRAFLITLYVLVAVSLYLSRYRE
ncbi:MAG: hypothetical protein ACREAM_16415 [Blastocatellia bacterium]